MTYKEKLRDPRWQKKRLLILERDGWKCTICGDNKRNLQVHHVVYRRLEPWEYPDYLYQSLCEDCHAHRQELTDKIVDAVRIAIMHKPTAHLEVSAREICETAFIEIKP
jgi:5-methylcytosine-specific restriction endonuclease McrA